MLPTYKGLIRDGLSLFELINALDFPKYFNLGLFLGIHHILGIEENKQNSIFKKNTTKSC